MVEHRRAHTVVMGAVGVLVTALLWQAEPAAAQQVCGPVVGGCEPAPAQPAPSQPAPTPPPDERGAEATLLSLINKERTDRGLPPMSRRGDVDEIALSWSRQMADSNNLSHNDAYFTAENRRRLDASALGENVAYNSSVQNAHTRLMASEGHRANILNPRFTVVGLGAVYRNNVWWITQDFVQPRSASAPAPAPAPAPKAAVAPAPAPAPAPVAAASRPTARLASAPAPKAAPSTTTTETAPPTTVGAEVVDGQSTIELESTPSDAEHAGGQVPQGTSPAETAPPTWLALGALPVAALSGGRFAKRWSQRR